VIQGAADKLVEPRCGRQLAAGIPAARLDMLSGSHMQPYTHPEAVASAVGRVAAAAAPNPARRG
jgi:hypothetical protein